MAHMIDNTNDRDNIAFAGAKPWHGLGAELTYGADLATWEREAGLAYKVRRATVLYRLDPNAANGVGEPAAEYKNRDVLFRSDTGAPLSVVSSDYKVVQPGEVLQFFTELVKHNRFSMEVAGVLEGGCRLWALARVNDGAAVIGHDVVRPYVLLATSYDGTLATVVKFTAVRVVCHNTLTMAAGYGAEQRGQSETDRMTGPVVQCVRVPHSRAFDAKAAQLDLGIAVNAWDRFLIQARTMAHTPVNETFAREYLRQLLPAPRAKPGETPRPVELTDAYKRILALFQGEAPMATMPEARGTAWGLLNAVTWFVDHERGSDAHRFKNAAFGAGDALKNKARDMLAEAIA
jgi:phage/plasmid-like protein (TIGR03299 family)